MSAPASRPAEPAGRESRGGAAPGLRLRAYAKVNLGLEVVGRRPDGFHEIVSVTQTISLADELEVRPGSPFEVRMDPPLVEEGVNLVTRAADLLAEATGRSPIGHLSIRKRIPLAAGLGGGSSDAAACLRLLDRLWGAHLGRRRVAEPGALLGSDVPLFLGTATSLIRGRGELVEALPAPPTFWLVLVCPGGAPPDKTRAMYRALTPADFSDGSRTLALADRLRAGQGAFGAALVNGFDAAADRTYPDLRALRARLTDLLQRPVHLTGAGPSLFALFEEARPAHLAARRARRSGLTTFVARSIARSPSIRATGR